MIIKTSDSKASLGKVPQRQKSQSLWFVLQVQENIQKILKNLSQFKESEASAPFAPQIESLEVRLNETTKKINLV
jgi:hypothetical protein